MSGLGVAFLLLLGPGALLELAEAVLAAHDARRAER